MGPPSEGIISCQFHPHVINMSTRCSGLESNTLPSSSSKPCLNYVGIGCTNSVSPFRSILSPIHSQKKSLMTQQLIHGGAAVNRFTPIQIIQLLYSPESWKIYIMIEPNSLSLEVESEPLAILFSSIHLTATN
eukprot:TRINITY_DN7826_c0_g1_i2.p1 TRINITY_DN7826_c0_g1~~TRINITY_DN7826_c0_g1_i2.p1  ORF type:complete len:133 (+),score=8.87 TRINITY_DN7826_c0_g1_i2:118-516(+)